MMDDLTAPSWPEILRACQDQVQARIHTMLPGIVRSYDVATQTAEVELAVQLGGVNVPPLADVPCLWPGGAAGFLHVPLAAGDTVTVLFAEEDFAKFWDSGSVSAPASLSRHGLHAVAIPGLRRAAAPLAVTAGHVTLAASLTSAVHLGADTATAFVALANLVDARLESLRFAFNNHMHATAALGPPSPPIPDPTALPTPPVIPVVAFATVAATKVKAV